jgi:hypothetical protein
MSAIDSKSGILHCEFVRLLLLQVRRETDRFFADSGVNAAVLRINLNIDGASIVSRSHTHTSHSQTSLLLTSSLSLGDPVLRFQSDPELSPTFWLLR